MKTKKKEKNSESRESSGRVFKLGSICLIFMVIGYQVALFVNRAAVMRISDRRDSPDTVYVLRVPEPAEGELKSAATADTVRRNSSHSRTVEKHLSEAVRAARMSGMGEEELLALLRERYRAAEASPVDFNDTRRR